MGLVEVVEVVEVERESRNVGCSYLGIEGVWEFGSGRNEVKGVKRTELLKERGIGH